MKIEERRYQIRAVEEFTKWIPTDDNLATIILPTGVGKTYVASKCLESFFHSNPSKKALWVAHREELIDQAHKALSFVMPNLSIEIEMADRKANPNSNIVVGSVQTIAKNRKHFDGFDPDIIVIDEYHHYAESNIQYDGLLKRWPKAKILGLTATPWRFGGENLPLGKVLIQMDIGTAVKHKYLVPPKAETLFTNVSLANVKTRMGDFATKDLSDAVNVDSRNLLIANKIKDLVKEGRQGILFAVDVNHSKSMYNILKNDVRAAEVYGETPTEERREIMRAAKNHEVDIILNNLVCLDDQTEILTSVGWQGIHQVTKNSLVANWEEGMIWFEKPNRVFQRDRAPNENMVTLQTMNRSIRVTENHDLLIELGGTYKKEKAKLLCNDEVDIPVSGCYNAFSFADCLFTWTTLQTTSNYYDLHKLLNLTQGEFDSALFGLRPKDSVAPYNADHHKYYLTNLSLANTFQAAATCHGYDANLRKNKDKYILTLTRQWPTWTQTHHVDSISTIGNSFQIESGWKKEKVWCVSTQSGNIVTRRKGTVTIMGNCTEGLDLPHLSFVCMARPTKSLSLYIQAIGRGLRLYPEKQDCIIVDVWDKIKVKQNRITFKEMAAAGDLYGDQKRAKNFLTTPVPIEPFSNTLINFPIFIKPQSEERWSVDDETFSVSSWMIAQDQWIVTWSFDQKTPKIITKTIFTKLNEFPNEDLTNRPVSHEKFGSGIIKSTDKDNQKVTVEFGWGEIKTMTLNSISIQKSVKEFAPGEFDISKIERLFYICLPSVTDKGRLLSFTRSGKNLILQEDISCTKQSADSYLKAKAVTDGIVQLIRSNAPWKAAPASDKQKQFVETIINNKKLNFNIDLSQLTKGEASAVIEQGKWQDIIRNKFGTDFKEKLLGYSYDVEEV